MIAFRNNYLYEGIVLNADILDRAEGFFHHIFTCVDAGVWMLQ